MTYNYGKLCTHLAHIVRGELGEEEGERVEVAPLTKSRVREHTRDYESKQLEEGKVGRAFQFHSRNKRMYTTREYGALL